MLLQPDLIISFDPGTKLGWSVFSRKSDCSYERVSSGVLDMSGKEWGSRFDMAASFVHTTIEASKRPLDKVAVVYENIQARTLRSWDNLRVITGVISAIYQGCYRAGVSQHEIFPVPLKSVKLHATGNGKASKKEMTTAFEERYGVAPTTDDEADAAHMASYCASVLTDKIARPNTVVWKRLAAFYEGECTPKLSKKNQKKSRNIKTRPKKGSSGGKKRK